MRRSLGFYLAVGWGCSLVCVAIRLITMEDARRFVRTEKGGVTLNAVQKSHSSAKPQPPLSTAKKFVYLKEPFAYRDRRNLDECALKRGVKWRMAVFVKSKAHYFFRRELFRRTWASYSYVDGLAIQTYFVIGSLNTSRPRLVEEEFWRYGDLLQYSGPDDYRHIQLKSLAAMNWASKNLPEDVFFSSMDDDVMVDVGAMVQTLREAEKTVRTSGWPEFPIVCTYKEGQKFALRPERNKTSKYYVPKSEYRWPTWPRFCLGGMYTMSGRIARQLWDVSRQHEPLRMDDVWITGILRERIGMPREMIVNPPVTVATHWRGYRKQKSSNIRDFMKDEWLKLKAKLKGHALCTV